MPLSAGDKLGHYEIVAPLGAGGMGEVYKARDTQLEREVAIKVLPRALANDPERLARFDREAKILAALNHPNIAVIYGLVESEGQRALVMELVPGDTLAAHIKSGPMPREEALTVAKQVAEALEAAHEKNVVHRDLKPGNIMISPTGLVKVLDFGLAAMAAPASVAPASRPEELSPTLTMGMTQAGVIMGTAAYMSPEQAAGLPVDRRADIWSYGVVLWEMLTGKRLFSGGESVSHTLADVLRAPIDLESIPAGPVRKLVKRCLDRSLKTRLQSIAEARIQIDEILAGGAQEEIQAPVPAAAPVPPESPIKKWVPWAVAALAIAGGAALAAIHFREKPPAADLTRFVIGPPAGATFTGFLSISPDGRKIAFTARTADEAGVRLWVRSLDALEAKPLTATALLPFPFWSPDSRFIGYQVDGKLKKIDIAGGPPVTLCDVATQTFRGGAWSTTATANGDQNGAGTILFGSSNGGLMRVSDQGGQPTPLTTLDAERQEIGHELPSFLPDGRNFLYLRRSSNVEKTGIYLGSLDFKPEQQASRRLLAAQTGAEYAAAYPAGSKVGHVLFLRESTLFSQPFDEGKLALAGEAVPVAEPVTVAVGRGLLSASANGALIYRTGESLGTNLRLTWFDRQGKTQGTVGDPANYTASLRLSPDGTRAATTRADGSSTDIWLVDLARGVSSRFTFDPAVDGGPVWSRDGSSIAFRSNRGGHFDLYQKTASGAGEDELLFKSDLDKTPGSWSRDGRFLLFHSTGDPKTQADQWVLVRGEARFEARFQRRQESGPLRERRVRRSLRRLFAGHEMGRLPILCHRPA
jgi:hypothetical protein